MAAALSVSLSIAMVGCATDEPVATPEPAEKPPSTAGVEKPAENLIPRIDPKKEKGLVSRDTAVAVSMTIRNQTQSPVSLYWLDEAAGERAYYKDIASGAEVVQETWKDHYWIILDKDDKPLGIYKTSDKDGVVVIK